MLSYEIIDRDTKWVGKFYTGGRIVGTYKELAPMMDDFRDFDIVCLEGQPDHLKEFYEPYLNQREYFLLKDYYDNVYSKKYDYYFVDEDLHIYADCGDEAEKKYNENHEEAYAGIIELTNRITGYKNTMYPITIC